MENETELKEEKPENIGLHLNNTEISKINFFLDGIENSCSNARRNAMFIYFDKIDISTGEIRKIING